MNLQKKKKKWWEGGTQSIQISISEYITGARPCLGHGDIEEDTGGLSSNLGLSKKAEAWSHVIKIKRLCPEFNKKNITHGRDLEQEEVTCGWSH